VQTYARTVPPSQMMLWTGRDMSTLVVLFLLFDSVANLIKIDPVVQSFAALGYPDALARGVGVIVLACALL
jgi:DoxX-like family